MWRWRIYKFSTICFLMFSTFKFSVVIQRFITSEDVCWSIRNVRLKFLLYRNAFILLYVYHRTFAICFFLSSVHLWLFLIVLHFLTGSVRFIPPPPPPEKNLQHLTQVGRLPVSSYCDKKTSCYQRACLSNMTLCLRKLPPSIVRTQARVNRWRIWRWKDKSLCTSDFHSQYGPLEVKLVLH